MERQDLDSPRDGMPAHTDRATGYNCDSTNVHFLVGVLFNVIAVQ